MEACIKVLSDVGKILDTTTSSLCYCIRKGVVAHIKSITGKYKYLPYYLSPAKSRAIAIPVDLDSQVNNLFVKSNNVVQKSILSWRLSAKNTTRRDSGLTSSKDYRNIIERLQVSSKMCSTVLRLIM